MSNVYPFRTWPDGMDCEVFTARILRMADERATDPGDREHVTPWIQRHVQVTGQYCAFPLPVDWSSVRLTVDTKEDLEWLKIALQAPRS